MKYGRIMIFGLPGSGKSTFAVRLAHQLDLPLYHLDKHFYIANWIERDKKEFLSIQHQKVEQERWVIDGNAVGSLEIRYEKADLVLYFCPSRFLCLYRLLKRRFFKDPSIEDRADSCPERLRLRLIKYMWTFDKRVKPLLEKLQANYPKVPFSKITSPRALANVLKLISKI